ncbi:MAG: DNA polymerase III subunit alpha [Pseudomonadota bacterium]|nr:DNA polymerase III subunit alpha [Pseudomonadota bacterium]
MTSKNNKFVHLRNYSQYSLSKGALRITDLIEFCINENIPAAAITDFGNLFGCLEFSLESTSRGVQPIIGSNILIKDNKYSDGNVLLLCKNEKGYKNLVKLVSLSYLENSVSNEPFISIRNLRDNSQGLICLPGGVFGILTKNFFNNSKLTDDLILELSQYFGKDFFLEIQRYENNSSSSYENFLLDSSIKLNIPLVATNENFFLNKEFYRTHDALLSISQQKYIESEDRLKSNEEFYLKDVDSMLDLFSDIPQACENTLLLAKKCSFVLEEKPPSLPKIKLNGFNEDELLKKESRNGLLNRLRTLNDIKKKEKYRSRLEYELDTIIKMGYSSYFLIVSDFINWAKKNNIPVGPGRGSGAGSLVAWCLFITDLDPIKFGLLFERFLNPERISLPDFDIDFCMDRRDEVINYVQKKYGNLNVAQIITFGSFQARAALRDVGRVLQLPLNQIDDICKMIPYNPANPISLKAFTLENSQIKKMIRNDRALKDLFEISTNLEGLLRHASTHAAGIVIAEKPLNDTVPLYKDPKSEIPVTQFSMKFVEKMGLIKFDFLGLKTLTVINETCNILKKRSINLDIDKINLHDSSTYEMLKKGLTTGVFQLEGQGMRETIMKVKPDRFEDLIAIVSLYRPGPMDNIPTYINRKQKNEDYNYVHEDLKSILDETYGIMVYQEQVMLIAQKLAGFSLSKADLLRRAMGKKIKSEMIGQKENFINGCEKNGINEEKASILFNEIEKFAGYGFNKSHAAAYAMIAYQTAYLKANFPLEFFCALMNCDLGNFEKLSIYCNEIKKLGFSVIGPNINNSDTIFTVYYDDKKLPKSIKFGLGAIKNIGGNSINELVNERKTNGNFKNLNDLLKRVSNNVLNKKILEALIYSNSLVSIEDNQGLLYENINKILTYNCNYHKNLNKDQSNLFPEHDDFNNYLTRNDSFKWDKNKKLQMEIEAFGFYLSEHPTKIYKSVYKDKKIIDLNKLDNSSEEKQNFLSNNFLVQINDVNERRSKTGKRYCFFNLSDDTSNLDVICFSEVLENLEFDIKIGEIYLFKISSQIMTDSKRLVVNGIKKINKLDNNELSYNIELNPEKLNFDKFQDFLKNNVDGSNKVFFKMTCDNFEVNIQSKQFYKIDMDFLDDIKSINGVLSVEQTN